MNHMTSTGRRDRPARAAFAFLLAFALAWILALAAGRAAAAEPSLGEDSQACQDCHDKPDLAMKTQDGKPWSLHVSTEAYLKSRHNTTDCVDCHEDIEDDQHAKDKPPVKSRRDFARALNDGCKSCHKKHVTLFEDSVHAALLRDGSREAPMCSDCHDVHTQRSVKILTPVADTPCLKCHEEIGKAWSADVHGLQRLAGGRPAPICADCHQAHAIQAASAGDGLRDACLGCHDDAVASHRDWLPNTGRHFEAISCPVCHAPTAQRRVNLRMVEGKGQRPLAEKSGVPRFASLASAADRQGRGLDERALWSLLQAFNDDTVPGDVSLRGRLEVREGVQAHRLAEKSKAIRECDTCHREGAEAFQSVVLSIAGPDGRPLRHDVDNQVLTSLRSIESVRGFYAIGANRIKLLDVLLVLVVLGSVGGVLAHMTVKWATRRMRDKVAAEQRDTPH
jgi:predicted CXXCH cytochrome family protein